MNSVRAVQKRIQRHVLALNSPDTNVALRAERNLIRYYGARALEPLLEAADHPNPEVRLRVAYVLGYTHDPRAYEALLQLTQDSSDIVCYDAAIALGVLGDARAVEPLIARMCTPGREGSVDCAAAKGLVLLGKPAVPALLALLKSATPLIQMMTATVLGGIGDVSAIAPIVDMLSHEDKQVRIAGIEALAEIGTPRCLAALRTCLEDSSEEVRKTAGNLYQELAQSSCTQGLPADDA